MKHSAEYQRFDKLVGDLLPVSHEEIGIPVVGIVVTFVRENAGLFT